jgi:pyruvate dehydrogenase E2 component (dihydrolipoamide acetyltransferase)
MSNTQSTSVSSTQEFKLPDLGEGMHEAEIRHWHVKAGDTLKLDQPMVEVETDKAVVEIPSPVSGRVAAIRVPDGQVAKVGEVLIVLETSAPSGASAPPSKSAPASPATPPTTEQPAPASTQAQATRPRVLAAPAVRKLAFELGVDLEQVTPSNPNGRVSIEDVRAYAERRQAVQSSQVEAASPAEPKEAPPAAQPSLITEQRAAPPIPRPTAADERQPLTGLRKRIAEHMERSWRTIPHATAFDEVDGSALVALRQALKPVAEQRGIHLTYIPLLIKLLLPLLKEFPIFNASLDEERREIIYKRSYHIGIATAAPEGLLVPVMRNADQLTLATIASELERLIEAARKRTLSLSEVSGSTFTLNNVGSFGGGSGTPIINHPEVAILAVGRLQEKPVVRDSAIIARPMMPLALSFDHRVIDGAMSGAFLKRFKELVENPQQLMLDMA